MLTEKREKFYPSRFVSVAALVILSATVGCSLFSSKKSEQPAPSVSGNDAGLNAAVDGMVVKMRNAEFLEARPGAERKICFLGVRDIYGNEIPELSESVRRRFGSQTSYHFVDDATIDAGLEKSGVKRNDLFIPEEREKLTAALGIQLDYLLSARIVQTGDAKHNVPSAESVLFELYSVSENTTVRVQRDLNGIYSVAEAKKKFLGVF